MEIDDVRIKAIKPLVPPMTVLQEHPATQAVIETVYNARRDVHRVLHGADDRLLVVVGPCSIHDPVAALEYAQRLLTVRQSLADDLLIVMRVYFEKPRTTVGWKGLINDPHLDGSFAINEGLRVARKLLLDLNAAGMPAGTEFLDMITPQYYADLVSWGAIGARTTESQIHRELSSGLSCPVGFKNGTDGNVRIAVDAIRAAQAPHHFLSVTKDGGSAIVSTQGNEDCHVILRGGREPNYSAEHVDAAAKDLAAAGLAQHLMVDLSHGNSRKQFALQAEAGLDIAQQLRQGEVRVCGVMIESHLLEGRQDLVAGQELRYGQSITDACLGWEPTVELLQTLAQAVRARRLALGEG